MQKQLRKPSRAGVTTEEVAAPATREGAEEVLSDIDSLLDEIDAVLEQNAEAFVKAYIQRGGQ